MDIRISVSDGRASAALAPFSIVVNQANGAPTISGNAADFRARRPGLQLHPERRRRRMRDPLTFSIANRPAWANFNAATGRLSGTPGGRHCRQLRQHHHPSQRRPTTVSLPAFSVEVQQAATGSAALSWQAPTTRTDGTPLTNLAGYHIRYGTSSGSYNNVITIPNGGITNAVVSNLCPAPTTSSPPPSTPPAPRAAIRARFQKPSTDRGNAAGSVPRPTRTSK